MKLLTKVENKNTLQICGMLIDMSDISRIAQLIKPAISTLELHNVSQDAKIQSIRIKDSSELRSIINTRFVEELPEELEEDLEDEGYIIDPKIDVGLSSKVGGYFYLTVSERGFFIKSYTKHTDEFAVTIFLPLKVLEP